MNIIKATKFGGIISLIGGIISGQVITAEQVSAVFHNSAEIVSLSLETIGILSVVFHALRDHFKEKKPI